MLVLGGEKILKIKFCLRLRKNPKSKGHSKILLDILKKLID